MEIAPINFCSKIAFNLRNEEYKNKILKELFDRYKIIVTENSCSIYDKRYSRVLVNQFNNPSHIISTNTKGNRYYLYFRRDEFDKNMCLFIDRKICRGYTQPRVIYTNFRMENDIFDGTLIHGELVKTTGDDWFFILNDIVSYCGKSLNHTKKIDRITYMYRFLQKQYTSDGILDVCKFQIKKFFTYTQLDDFMNYIKQLQYQVNGILFNSLNPSKNDILLLHNMETSYKFTPNNNMNPKTRPDTRPDTRPKMRPDTRPKTRPDTRQKTRPIPVPKQYSNIRSNPAHALPPKQTNITHSSDVCFTFYITKIEGGIYQLIGYVNKNEKVFGNARIDKMKTQRMVERILGEKDKVLIDCKYNIKFKKFVPCGESVNYEPSQYIDITRYIESL
jgi:hypothetical protein